ncbi:MAG: PQQ-dependent sugar dehydrogenase [Blastocatellia bacterium]
MSRRSVYFILLFLLCQFHPEPVPAQTFTEPGFVAETVATLPPYSAVGLTFAPDGRIFIWQKNGVVRIIKNSLLLETPFIDISPRVNNRNDRGLLGVGLDPDFSVNGYVYLYYIYEDGPDNTDYNPKTARLTRVTANPARPDEALPGSEVVLLGSLGKAPCSQYAPGADCIGADVDSHNGGTIRFGPDRKLYLSIGDAAPYNFPDALTLRAQNLDSYNGKILRLNTDGTAPAGNPFSDGTNSIRSKVLSYGLRNPFRFALHPVTSELYLGDVGSLYFEELNIGRGANFGWPCYEGAARQPDNYPALPACAGLTPDKVRFPVHAYNGYEGRSIIAGGFYTAGPFPDKYRGSFFFGDYDGKWIRRAVLGPTHEFVAVEPFANGVGDVVAVEPGPDGALYYILIESGELRRIRYSQRPVARISASATTGLSPLTVNFSGLTSTDPNNAPLTYNWDFGDGTTGTGAQVSRQFVSPLKQIFTVRLTVTNDRNLSDTTTVDIIAGNNPPAPVIAAPGPGTSATPGQRVSFRGAGTDPDEALQDTAMSWQVLLHHDDHAHPYLTAAGPAGSFVAEDHGPGRYFFEIILTVTDSFNVSRSTSVTVALLPNTAPVVSMTSPQNGATLQGAGEITLTASASDNDGAIARVEFFAGSRLISAATSAPYRAAWISPAPGAYTLTARAVDNLGLPTVSTPVSVTIRQPDDTDGDGIPDLLEPATGTDPLRKDNDILTSSRLFVMQQYRDIHNREAESGGLAYWQGQIDSGASTRAQVIGRLLGVNEFNNALPPLARLYFAAYQRTPDYGGMSYWLGQLRRGRTLASIAGVFAGSAEFTNRYGALGDSGYVTQIFRNTLDRDPNATELNSLTTQLGAGQLTRGQLMILFSERPEFVTATSDRTFIYTLYHVMLRRTPDTSGFTLLLGRLATQTRTQVIQSVLDAAEYRKRFLP